MSNSFNIDSYPGRPKILFIGFAESTHTHSWIDLLDQVQMNVRLFSIPNGGLPPEDWKVKTYVTAYYTPPTLERETRVRLFAPNRFHRLAQRISAKLRHGNIQALVERWLSQVIRLWQPDIIHTLGLDPAGDMYLRTRRRYGLEGIGKWVLQLRGGSDLTLSRLDPELVPRISEVVRSCDQLISDNPLNFDYARQMGIREEQIASLGNVPGTGGMDVLALAEKWQGKTSSRRIIVWPKVYESPWAKVLPVYEAIKLCWEQIQPCEIHLLSMSEEARMWYWALPEEIRRHCVAQHRLPRAKVLELMSEARVMLAPSLVDGVPNSMYEAMAAGAFPVVSPLETIRPLVENEQNVLFARNLYPHEIAGALSRAMSDDALVDDAAERNLALVKKIADRSIIRARVVNYYEDMAAPEKTER
jgi:glycosyltransferase involved in cell wall biosynthesis